MEEEKGRFHHHATNLNKFDRKMRDLGLGIFKMVSCKVVSGLDLKLKKSSKK